MAPLSELGTYAKLSTGRPGRAMIDTFESRRQGGPQGRAHIREVSAGAGRGLREMLRALCVALIEYSKHTKEFRLRRPPWLPGWALKIVEIGRFIESALIVQRGEQRRKRRRDDG